MATPATQFSLEHHLIDRLRYSGMDSENLADLVNIVVSLRNKYGMLPAGISAHGVPVPDRVIVRYLVEPLALNKITNVLLDTPRLASLTAKPHGLPQTSKFEVDIILGG